MTNRNAEKIRRRRENRKENQTPAALPRSNNLWFWILAAASILILGLLSYFAYTSNFTNELVIPITASVTILLLLIIWYLPKFYVRSLPVETGKDFDREKERIKLEDDTRKTITQIVGGIVLLGGLFFTYNTFRLQQDLYRLQQEGQFTDRFTKAVAQLGDDKLEIRLGGMYALERIAKDSPKDHWTVMEILSAFIRENTKINEKNVDEDASNEPVNEKVSEIEINGRVTTDIQAALTIIKRRKIEQDSITDKINLSKTDLKRADLSDAILNGADLRTVNLSVANLRNVDLKTANLIAANLSQAILNGAKLSNAILFQANLNDASIESADLSNANLGSANLRRAKLFRTNLSGADLSGADLSGAILRLVDLRDADLWMVENLTFEQISNSIINENTKLPDYLENRKAELLEISKNNLAERQKI